MIRTELSAKSILTALLCFLVVWAPLPFASVTPAARAAIQLAAFLSVLLAALSLRSSKALTPVVPVTLSLAGMALLAFATSLPWPHWVVGLLSPAHARLADEAAAAVGRPVSAWIAPSLAPELSRLTAICWAAVAALVLSAAIAGRRQSRRRWLVGSIFGSAAIQALFALRARLGGVETIWGRAGTSTPGDFRGTFVNPNHAAFFFMIATALALALVWWAFRKASRESSSERKFLLRSLPVALWLALLMAVAMTGSRAGLIASFVAMAVQLGLMSLKNRRWWLVPLGLGPALAVMLIAAMASGRSSLERVLGTSVPVAAESYRVEAWSASLALWHQFPLLGTGAGSFREAFPMVKPGRLVRETWHHAHNDILELLTTGGAAAMLILIVGIAAVVMRLIRILRHARRTDDRAFAIGAAGVLSGALMHELLDFSLTIPANWVAVSVVLGAALGIWIRPDARRRSGSVPASQSD